MSYSWWESEIKIKSFEQYEKLIKALLPIYSKEQILSSLQEMDSQSFESISTENFVPFTFDIGVMTPGGDRARVMSQLVETIIQEVSSEGHMVGYSDDGVTTLFAYINGQYKEVEFEEVAKRHNIAIVEEDHEDEEAAQSWCDYRDAIVALWENGEYKNF